MDVKRAKRRLGALAPAALVVAVPVAAIAVTNAAWSAWAMGALSVAAVWLGTWWALAGTARWIRVSAGVAAVLVSAASLYLGIAVLWPSLASSDGLVSNWAFWGYALFPWLPLVFGGTFATISGKQPGAAPAWPWWLAALIACGLAYPLVGWVTTAFQADDMAMLVLLFIPVYALGLWLGPVGVVAATTAVRRVSGAPAQTPPAAESAPSAEVTRT